MAPFSAGSGCCCTPSAEGKQLGLLPLLGASLKTVVGEIGERSSSPSCCCASPELGLCLPALEEEGALPFLHCCGTGSAVCSELPWEPAAVSLHCAGAVSSGLITGGWGLLWPGLTLASPSATTQ